ncbi:hypothetical protein BG000_006700, partial [Podila horticola]
MSITSDNGSNVLKLTMDFETYTRARPDEWSLFRASKQHVPCLAHVMNLAVQAMLGKGGLGAEAPADAESMDIEDDDDAEGLTHISIAEEDDKDDEEDDSDKSVDNNASAKRALKKLRKGIVKI